MQLLFVPLILILSYVIGSIPFGLVIVRLSTGKDVRKIESGRTGGTNAFRAAGLWAGLGTALLDGLKGASTVWLVRFLQARAWLPADAWMQVFAPILSIVGHNYSIFLLERNEKGRLRLRGGAGGAPTGGGAFGLWPPTLLFIIPLCFAVWYFVGYASLATLSAALIIAIIFAVRAWIGVSPWQYIFYGILAELLLMLALMPNIRRLLNGTERMVGLRARLRDKRSQTPINPAGSPGHSSS